jgi:hypothetical protein
VSVRLSHRSKTFTHHERYDDLIIQPLTADDNLGAKYVMYAAYSGPRRSCRVIPGTPS